MAKTKAPASRLEKHITPKSDMTLIQSPGKSELWYKILVLLHDLCNIASDRAAEARTLAATDELYISGPYFTPEEAALIKSTLISPPSLNEMPEFELLILDDTTDNEVNESLTTKEKCSATTETMPVEAAIKSCLQNFFEKRRASGDARPCGPHDMGPIYQAVFGVTKEDLKNEKFLGWLRRAGLSQPKEKTVDEGSSSKQKKKRGPKA